MAGATPTAAGKAGVDVYAYAGVTDGRGAFGYAVYVREEQFDRAALALGI
jgi:hypothetical protein